MQLQQLAYLVAVADTRHFTRAADDMGVAQPTLSQQIRALEADVGATLIVRRPRNIELTAAGEELVPIARRILADVENARRALSELADRKRGRVRLGATPSLVTGLLPEIVADFSRTHPGVNIVIDEGGSWDLRNRLSAARLDLALVTDTAETSELSEDGGVVTTPLFEENLVLITAPHKPAPTRRTGIAISELREIPLVMFRQGYDLRERTLAACRAHGFDPLLALECGEMDAVLSFVAAGTGAAIVPTTVADTLRFRVTPLRAPGLSRTVQLAYRSGIELPPAAAELARRLSALAN